MANTPNLHNLAIHVAPDALLNFSVTILLTPLCSPTSEASRDLVDQVREPVMHKTGPRMPGL
jgi:hypothetical protein